MKYYDNNDLTALNIDNYSNQLKKDRSINYSDELVDNDDKFIFYSANIFLQGVCQIFAYALHKRFGYHTYIIRVERLSHVFCKTSDNQYVDVRGRTDSFEEFIDGTSLPNLKEDISETYSFVEDDFACDYADIAIAFANAIIDSDVERYKV